MLQRDGWRCRGFAGGFSRNVAISRTLLLNPRAWRSAKHHPRDRRFGHSDHQFLAVNKAFSQFYAVRQAFALTWAGAPIPRSNARGGVAQLVRALPCHGRGRGFESRRSRHFINDLAPVSGSRNAWTFWARQFMLVDSPHPRRPSAVLRRVRHAGRLAHQHRARGRGHPAAARPLARLAGLRRRLARRIPAGDGGSPQPAGCRSASSTCCTGAISNASCRASTSPACPKTVLRDLNLAWHRLDAWPEVPAALARLKTQVPARAGVERQHLADGRSRAPQRLSVGRDPRLRDRRRLQAEAAGLSRRLRGVRSRARRLHDGGGAFQRSRRRRGDAGCAPAISRGRTSTGRATARRAPTVPVDVAGRDLNEVADKLGVIAVSRMRCSA